MNIISKNGITPRVGKNVFIAPTAYIIGDVEIGDNCSIFFGAVLRGDINPIKVGNGTNIQEHCMLHTSDGLGPCIVEDNVTVGHRAVLHGCHVKSNSLIGMGSIILDDAVIEVNSVVGAGSLVTMGKKFPPSSLIIGSPARAVRNLTEEDLKQIESTGKRYQRFGKNYQEIFKSL